jgi:GNAT superfamily N-acetyltransferase
VCVTPSWTLRPAIHSEVPAIAALLGRAFDADPVMTYIFPRPTARATRLPRLFSAMLRHSYFRHGAIDVALAGDDLRGVAIWTPPGDWLPPKRQQLAAFPAFAYAFGSRFVAGQRAMAAAAKAHPSEPHWYLAVLGVDPSHQGASVGGTLLRAGLARCDQQRLPAYLDTGKPENLAYYARFGFTVSAEIPIAGGPVAWLLRREAIAR